LVVVNPRFTLDITRADGRAYKVKGLASATVRMDREKSADELELEFPAAPAFTLDLFAPEDVVALALGYKEFGPAPVFEGLITEVGPNLPLNVKAKSRGEAARTGAYKKTYDGQKWVDIARDALTRAGLEPVLSTYPAPTTPPKKFRVDGQTPAGVLDRCAEETGWCWYSVPGTAKGWFGPRWEEPASEGKTWLFVVGRNVFADGCKLEYIKDPRVKRVVVTLTDADFEKPSATGEYKDPQYKAGDAEKKLSFAVSDPKAAAAKDRAREEFLKVSTSGYTGSFTAVGNPYVLPGSRIAILAPRNDDTVRHATVAAVDHKLADGEYTMDVTVAGGATEGTA